MPIAEKTEIPYSPGVFGRSDAEHARAACRCSTTAAKTQR
ncbi:hypothetical protein BIFANG_02472 [Bifidobacterium angulatum DSM 20098 = JCM 7096]|uniref:Uncharacterized protein n=1 Tax=Bifidobacterium angulatum DSM 20098 = JCM 7096 TaxID=518635 RepID=C4FDT4_9BIFI|nr:hypothetical protein BIFANG_02472 [Bifidobacterium angulatum DSM 20098 = JCM 7096]